MILYHGSDVEVKEPKIIASEKGRDFGQAFYLTPIKEQAEKMAKRKKRINGTNSAFVSVLNGTKTKMALTINVLRRRIWSGLTQSLSAEIIQNTNTVMILLKAK